MRISAKTEYACIAMLDLAAHYGAPEPLRIRSIAKQHGVPARFLVQILLQLKGVGLVASTRGAAGGYRLAKDPSEIKLGDVINAMEGTSDGHSSNGRHSPAARALADVYREVSDVAQRRLAEISFADLAVRASQEGNGMYYI